MQKMTEKMGKQVFSWILMQFTHMYVNKKSNYLDILHAKTEKNHVKNMSKMENRAIFKKL